jgi:formylglycine-generating enzyme required for sulfatase activity
MVLAGAVCMDRYEAYVVEVGEDGSEKPHSPYDVLGKGHFRAKNAEGHVPQAYISQLQSKAACEEADKRLCAEEEFTFACSGGDPSANDYPYGGHEHKDGYCNEGKGSQMVRFFGNDPKGWSYADFNDPRLNQVAGGLAKSGAYPRCVSSFGVHDCVGNLHEWGADPPDGMGTGRFRGGFYGDAEVNGHGCKYVTRAHGPGYHDYSTGFRCCKDPDPRAEIQWAGPQRKAGAGRTNTAAP